MCDRECSAKALLGGVAISAQPNKAKGVKLQPPAPLSGSDYFAADPEVVLQLHSSSTASCWSQSFAAASVKKNEAEQFKAKAP